MSRRKLRHVIAAAAVLLPATLARAETFKVKSGVASDLQDALDAAAAGDTIVIAGGPYVGNFLVQAGKDGLVIKGHATIDAFLGNHGLVINSDGVTVSGLTIRHSVGAGLRAPFGGPPKLLGLTLSKCHFVSCGAFGLNLVADDAAIRSCTLTGCDGGLQILGNNAVVSKCTIANDGTNGIVVAGNGTEVSKCTCTEIEDGGGITVNGDGAVVEHNHVSDCDGTGIFVSGADGRIEGNIVTDIMDAGISVGGLDCQVLGNRVESTDGDGIDATGTNLVVSKNHVSHMPDDSEGLAIASTGGAVIESNVVDLVAEYGLDLSVTSAIVRKNKVSHSGTENEGGILAVGDNNTLEQNVVTECDNTGIYISGDNNDVIKNRVTGATNTGLHVLAVTSENNVLDANTCKSNEGQGLINGGVGTILRDNTCRQNLLDIANETGAGATIVDDGGNSFSTGGFTTEPLVP